MSNRQRKALDNARNNRLEIVKGRLSRRELFKLGLVTGAGYLVGKSGLSARATAATGDDDKLVSPPTRPFVVELPFPPIKQPVAALNPAPTKFPNAAAGEGRPEPHQAWELFPPVKLYEVEQRPGFHSFHPDLPLNTIWGYDGIFPGPTFIARHGEPILVRHRNLLPTDNGGFGINQVSTHLHGGHTASESDGNPVNFFDAGQFYDNHYPSVRAGFSDRFAPTGDPREYQSTLWYHDHRFDFTAQNTYKGLAGFYLLFGEEDSGDETDPNPRAFRLPSGEFDIPMVFADKVFDENGQVFFDLFNLDGILGDKYTVNGVIQPFLRVARRKYRFRLLDSGPARFYEFFLRNETQGKDMPFIQVSNDGNLLPRPLTRKSVRLSVAERADIVVDFSQAKLGDVLFLDNRLEQKDGRGPTGKILSQGDPVVKFIVEREAPDPSRVPEAFLELPQVSENPPVLTRVWEFERKQGAWAVNGQFFDPSRLFAFPKLGTAERWILRNVGGGWSHPIHIHLEVFQILTRNKRTPPPDEIARKDTVRLGPNDEVEVYQQFRGFLGKYPLHCHNILHEDHAMMLNWAVVR